MEYGPSIVSTLKPSSWVVQPYHWALTLVEKWIANFFSPTFNKKKEKKNNIY